MMQKRTQEQWNQYHAEYKSGKTAMQISKEYNIPTQTIYNRSADMGGKTPVKNFKGGTIIKKRTYTKPSPAPITLELAKPQSSGKVVLMIVDRAQVKNILSQVKNILSEVF